MECFRHARNINRVKSSLIKKLGPAWLQELREEMIWKLIACGGRRGGCNTLEKVGSRRTVLLMRAKQLPTCAVCEIQ